MIVDMWDQFIQGCFGFFKIAFTVWLAWMGYLVWEEYMIGGEELDAKK